MNTCFSWRTTPPSARSRPSGSSRPAFASRRPGDGRDALIRFRQGSFDLVVLDVMLPSLDGFEVCKEIRRESQAPIVMLTARSELHDVIVGLELGADDYVTKPFELPELVARIKAVLRRSAAEPADETIAIDDLEIDPGSFSVRRGGEEVRSLRRSSGCCSSWRGGRSRSSPASSCSSWSGTTTTSATRASSTSRCSGCGRRSRTTRSSRS